jgi:hypothetical protein
MNYFYLIIQTWVENCQQISTVTLTSTINYIVIISFFIFGNQKEPADLIHRPLDLLSNALPLRYIPDFFLQELCNTQILYIYYSSS